MVNINDNKFPIKGAVATQNIFKFLGFKLISGLHEKVLAEPDSAVITKKCGQKLFGESEVVGKAIFL